MIFKNSLSASSPRVIQSATRLTTSWFVGQLSCNPSMWGKIGRYYMPENDGEKGKF